MPGVAGVRHFIAGDESPAHLPTLLPVLQHRYGHRAMPWRFGPIELAVAAEESSSQRGACAAPPTSRCGRYSCAFDGVITNRTLLRQRIDDRWCPVRGANDAELLIEHTVAFGLEDTLQRLDGAFALALWDHHEQTLTLARDRFGVQPLVYRIERSESGAPRRLIFASERKALRSSTPSDGPRPDDVATLMQLLGNIGRSSLSPFEHAHDGEGEVPPGTAVTFDSDGVRIERRTADLTGLLGDAGRRLELRAAAPSDRIERLLDTLTRSIRARTEESSRVTCLLGGDLSSALLAALTARLDVHLSLVHADTGCTARRKACEALAEHLRAPLTTVAATDASIRANLADVTWHLETPMPAGSAAGAVYRASKRARALRTDVLLHGGGGRHLLGGLGLPVAGWARRIRALQARWAAMRLNPLKGSMIDRITQIRTRSADGDGFTNDREFLRHLSGSVRRAERMASAWGAALRLPFLSEEMVALATALPPSWRSGCESDLGQFLRFPALLAQRATPLGRMVSATLPAEVAALHSRCAPDLPSHPLPAEDNFLIDGPLARWLGLNDRLEGSRVLEALAPEERDEWLRHDVWTRLFIDHEDADEITRALLGHGDGASTSLQTESHSCAAPLDTTESEPSARTSTRSAA